MDNVQASIEELSAHLKQLCPHLCPNILPLGFNKGVSTTTDNKPSNVISQLCGGNASNILHSELESVVQKYSAPINDSPDWSMVLISSVDYVKRQYIIEDIKVSIFFLRNIHLFAYEFKCLMLFYLVCLIQIVSTEDAVLYDLEKFMKLMIIGDDVELQLLCNRFVQLNYNDKESAPQLDAYHTRAFVIEAYNTAYSLKVLLKYSISD